MKRLRDALAVYLVASAGHWWRVLIVAAVVLVVLRYLHPYTTPARPLEPASPAECAPMPWESAR